MTPDEAKMALAEKPEGLVLKAKVVPQATRTRVVGLLADRIKIFVASPPEDGKANEALVNCLALALGVPKRDVEIVAGHTQNSKLILLRGVSKQEAADRLSLCTPQDE